jgi:hypothetical protein
MQDIHALDTQLLLRACIILPMLPVRVAQWLAAVQWARELRGCGDACDQVLELDAIRGISSSTFLHRIKGMHHSGVVASADRRPNRF